jgi:hypothetical protein
MTMNSSVFWEETPRLAYFPTLKMEAMYSSETSADLRSYIPEDRTLHSHLCQNLKFNLFKMTLFKTIRIAISVLLLDIVYCLT